MHKGDKTYRNGSLFIDVVTFLDAPDVVARGKIHVDNKLSDANKR